MHRIRSITSWSLKEMSLYRKWKMQIPSEKISGWVKRQMLKMNITNSATRRTRRWKSWIGNIEKISLLRRKGIDRSLNMLKTSLSSKSSNSEISTNNRRISTNLKWIATSSSWETRLKSTRKKLIIWTNCSLKRNYASERNWQLKRRSIVESLKNWMTGTSKRWKKETKSSLLISKPPRPSIRSKSNDMH